MSARAETSNAYRLCLFTMVYGATVTNQKYTAMYYYLEQKSNEEEGEKERRKSGAKSRARRTKYSINFSSLLFEDQASSSKLKTAIVLEAVRNFLALMRCSVREPLRFFSWRKWKRKSARTKRRGERSRDKKRERRLETVDRICACVLSTNFHAFRVTSFYYIDVGNKEKTRNNLKGTCE